jgi:hypothetical protein
MSPLRFVNGSLHLCRYPTAQGHALTIVLVFGAISLSILAATLSWVSSTSRLNDRTNRYFAAVAAAEAATEQVLAELSVDYHKIGAAHVVSKTPAYRNRVPHAAQHGLWSRFRFSNANGAHHQTSVEQVVPWAVRPLISQYQGLSGYASLYRLTSNARDLAGTEPVIAAVQQDIQIANIPIFQFAIFYNLAMEINPGPDMTIKGRVHSNGDVFMQPQSQLRFLGDVTAAGDIVHNKMPGDPSSRTPGSITYLGASDSGINSLNLPLGTDNSPTAVRQILERPPVSEPPDSTLGRERLYNKADLIIKIYDDHVDARGGVANGNGPDIGWSTVQSFVNTNVTFFNKREGRTIQATEINVGALAAWNSTHHPLKTALGRDVSSVYVVDLRTQTTATQPGIRLVNGQSLLPSGLTVITPQPLYVQGHYNVPPSAVGSSNTSATKPAALIADAITILSTAWQDSRSHQSLNNRAAANTTVNAAFLAGSVATSPSTGYSGGVENFPRFLENWSGRELTYNGSMIVMFESQVATAAWRGTGTAHDIYNPPTRNWNFDSNFLDPTRLPPVTPSFRTVTRVQWRILPHDPSA